MAVALLDAIAMTSKWWLCQIVCVVGPAIVFNLELHPDNQDEQPRQLSSAITACICLVVRLGIVLFGDAHCDGFRQRLHEFV